MKNNRFLPRIRLEPCFQVGLYDVRGAEEEDRESNRADCVSSNCLWIGVAHWWNTSTHFYVS